MMDADKTLMPLEESCLCETGVNEVQHFILSDCNGHVGRFPFLSALSVGQGTKTYMENYTIF